MPADSGHAQELYLRLVTLPRHERAAALDRGCGNDVDLRQRVEELLSTHDASAIESGDDGPTPTHAAAPLTVTHVPEPAETTDYRGELGPGAVIAGRYTLRDKIGEGGMGKVWAAKQSEPVTRKVALKLIKLGMDSKSVVTRFEQERQALFEINLDQFDEHIPSQGIIGRWQISLDFRLSAFLFPGGFKSIQVVVDLLLRRKS